MNASRASLRLSTQTAAASSPKHQRMIKNASSSHATVAAPSTTSAGFSQNQALVIVSFQVPTSTAATCWSASLRVRIASPFSCERPGRCVASVGYIHWLRAVNIAGCTADIWYQAHEDLLKWQ